MTLDSVWAKDLDIVFVGINPRHESAEQGEHFHENKSFWLQLNKSEITSEITDSKNMLKYNIGIDNLIHRATKTSEKISNKELYDGRKELEKKILEQKPKTVCFLGKKAFRKYFREKSKTHGWQKNKIKESKVFIAYYPKKNRYDTKRNITEADKIKKLKELKSK
ncbi:MAG: mismatch-specific DNA-glycosylase [Candidatus ainarchaeum sp.]|nr:mismatch-specific DNA-glycosylase [Candidatus ainarchaeum sp.]